MAFTFTPPYPQTPKLAYATIAAANTATDGSGTIVNGPTIGANGAFLKKVTFRNSQATAAASSAMVGKLWISLDAGSTWNLLDTGELTIPTATRSTTAIGQSVSISFVDGKRIPASAILGATQSVYAGAQDRQTVEWEYTEF